MSEKSETKKAENSRDIKEKIIKAWADHEILRKSFGETPTEEQTKELDASYKNIEEIEEAFKNALKEERGEM